MKIDPNDPIHPGMMNGGLTIRAHFAAMAMQGMLAGRPEGDRDETINKKAFPAIAEISVGLADALIAELNK